MQGRAAQGHDLAQGVAVAVVPGVRRIGEVVDALERDDCRAQFVGALPALMRGANSVFALLVHVCPLHRQTVAAQQLAFSVASRVFAVRAAIHGAALGAHIETRQLGGVGAWEVQ